MKKWATIRLLGMLILFVVSTNLAVFGQTMERGLQGAWRFRIGDDPAWADPNYDDSGWTFIKVPSRWEDQGFRGYDGYAWYRKKIVVPNEMRGHILTLQLGYIDDVDEAYINGVKIGQSGAFPPHFSTAYTALRQYQLPANAIRFGEENTIAVRVYDAMLDGGILSGDIKIYSTGILPPFSIDLAGPWEFNKGKDYNERTAKPIHVPGAWENQGYNDYDGYAVYTKKIKVDENLTSQRLVLLAGKIDDADKLLINGHLIAQTGEFSNWSRIDFHDDFRNYFLPPGTLEAGTENTIQIIVDDYGRTGGIYEGPVGIMTQDQFRAYWKAKRKN